MMSQIEKLGEFDPKDMLLAMGRIEGVRECVVLKTCNRVEIYISSSSPEATRRGLENFINGQVPFGTSTDLVQYLTGPASVRHLLRVSCGLESMILGEDQIQGQVREAFELAQSEGFVGPTLSVVFRKAISVGKKVRTETRVNKGCVSVGSAAVELAESKVGSLRGKNILVVGAGDMATLIAKHLAGKGPQAVFVSNRTYSRAVDLAFALNGKAVRFDSIIDFLGQADVVLVATAATHILLTKDRFEQAMAGREDRRLVVIDVSFPRNVEPQVAEVPGVELYDIDGLRGVAEVSIMQRKAEIKNAELIIADELESLDARIKEMRADELLSRLYFKFNSLKDREMRKAANRLAAGTEPPASVLADFANSLTKKFLADPTEVLKEASRTGDVEMLEIVGELFKVEDDNIVSRKSASKIADEQ